MFSLPKRPKILIGGLNFIPGPPKQIEVCEVENLGRVDTTFKSKVCIRPSTNPTWTDLTAVWDPVVLAPGSFSKATFSYEWTSGETYFVKVATEEGVENTAHGKAP